MEVGQSPEETQVEIHEKKHERLVAETKEKVRNRLKLDEGLPRVSPEIKKRMTTVIAETIVDTAEVLNVPLPEIKLFYEWGNKEEEKKYKKKDLGIGMSYLDKARKTGVVLFAPWRLKEFVQNMKFPTPAKERHEDKLRLALAHEMYHFRVDKKFPKVTARKRERIAGVEEYQIFEWGSSRVEYAAELFARKYLKNRKAEGWKQIVGKSLALAENQLKLQLMRMSRRLADIERRQKKVKKRKKKKPLFRPWYSPMLKEK